MVVSDNAERSGSRQVELICPLGQPSGSMATMVGATTEAVAGQSLRGLRVSIVDNTKANAADLLEFIRQRLVADRGALVGSTVRKPVSGPISDVDLATLAQTSDLVIVGTAD